MALVHFFWILQPRGKSACSYLSLTDAMNLLGKKSKSINERGKVILQTFDPYHWVIKKVMEYDFKSLYKQELADRKHFKYPPYFNLTFQK